MTQRTASLLSAVVAVALAIAMITALNMFARDMEFTWALRGAGLVMFRILHGLVITAAVIVCMFTGVKLEDGLSRPSIAAKQQAARYMSGYDGQQHKD